MTFRAPPRLAHYSVGAAEDSPRDSDKVRVFLRRVPGGPTLVLIDAAGLIWQVASQGVVDIPAAVADIVGFPVDVIRTDVEDYVDSLVSLGLLEPRDSQKPLHQKDS